MRKLGVWGLAASLALGLAGQTCRAEDDREQDKPSSESFWQWRWGRRPKPAEKKADDAEEAKADEDGKSREEREARLSQQMVRACENYSRRQAVCDRLKEVAVQQRDTRLEQRAQALEERAWALFLKKKAQLKGLAGPSSDVPEGDEAGESPRKEVKP